MRGWKNGSGGREDRKNGLKGEGKGGRRAMNEERRRLKEGWARRVRANGVLALSGSCSGTVVRGASG